MGISRCKRSSAGVALTAGAIGGTNALLVIMIMRLLGAALRSSAHADHASVVHLILV
jgi:hypothetical protein